MLRVVVALYEMGSVGRTARGMSPTTRTQALASSAREMLARVADDVLSETSFDPPTTTTTITFALSDVGEMVFLPKIPECLQQRAPGAAVRSVSLPPTRLDQFLSLGHAVVRAGGRIHEIFEKYLERRKISRRIALLVPHFMSIPTIIGKSDLVVTLPHVIGLFFSQTSANIKIVEPPLAIPRTELRQHWHRNAHHSV